MFPIKNVEDLQILNEAISLQNQVHEVRLQGKLGEQNYHEDSKKLFKIIINNVSKFENRANVIIGPRNVGKTYYMLKVLEKLGNKRPIHIITRSPNQYPNYEMTTEIQPVNKYKGSVVIFDDMLGAKNSSLIDEFLREAGTKI